VVTQAPTQGYYSLLRWRPDIARDEPRNIAVILVDEHRGLAAFRPGPVSVMSSKLHEQGLLDAALVALQERVESDDVSLDQLRELSAGLESSLLVTDPQPVAVHDADDTLTALYRTFVAARTGRSPGQTKGAVLDRVVSKLRGSGWTVERAAYLDDFLFDVVITDAPGHADAPRVISVLSFASSRKDWSPIEKDAGHFLYAREQLGLPASAVLQEPAQGASDAREHFERVQRWMTDASVRITDPNELVSDPGLALF
jgi:Protein of unknown function (DUF3037)